jgi:CubicO group peptidase (beta-lactamase class C family)
MLWSASKTVSAYAFGVAVSKGIVSYDQLVCRDWPEFATDEGKKALTVKEILQHRSGFAVLDVPVSPEMLSKAGMKKNLMAEAYEKTTQQFPDYQCAPSSKSIYHRMFRDNFTGEVVRKALGGNTTFGEWSAENVFKPLSPEGT